MRSLLLVFLLFFPAVTMLPSQNEEKKSSLSGPPFLEAQSTWIDSVFASLSLEQKIGQLFMVAAYSNKGSAHKRSIEALIRDHHIGGLIFFQGGPVRQARLTNYYQSKARVPLLIAQDAEWGLGMRLDSTMSFPRQLTLGAIRDNALIYEMGKEIARQCRRLGVHVNLAPVVDINNNPNNPVINDRSFGENKFNVTIKGYYYMKGMQDNRVMACAKHFPGHGDTDKDSHKTLPVIPHSRQRLDSLELYPFRKMIDGGIGGVMSAHLFIPALDSTPNQASSVSKAAVYDLLRSELGFSGLIFTDALNMKGVSQYYVPGDLDLKALMAGNDVLLFPEQVPKAIKAIKGAIMRKEIPLEVLDWKVKKILKAKYWAGLDHFKPIETENLYADLNTPQGEMLNARLTQAALTLVANKNDLIPIRFIDTISMASVSIGANQKTEFQQTLDLYAPVKHFHISKDAKQGDFNRLLEELDQYEAVFISLHRMSRYASRNYGITTRTKEFIQHLRHKTDVVLTLFGSPYSLKYFDRLDWIQVAYQDNAITQQRAAQLIFGGISAFGKLPVTASERFKFGLGIQTPAPCRLGYGLPEEKGISSADLREIDSIAREAINDGATPGCQILVAKNNTIIYQKSFGHHTYNKVTPVSNTDIYDLASITKIAGTMLSLMHLYDLNQFRIDKRLSNYIPDLDQSNKGNLLVKDILMHQSQLRDWIPFYMYTLNKDGYCDSNYCYKPDPLFSTRVAENLYIRNGYNDTIWKKIVDSRLRKKKEYKYSDLGFYIFQAIAENINQEPLDEYVQEHFYGPLGLTTLGYLPRKKFPLSRIVPTEDDQVFRRQLIHGDVHDPGAAMKGGVAGHAGLFSNTNDLAIVMQMLLNKGEYGGERFINASTIEKFTSYQTKDNRRGLGFDKPEPDPNKGNPASDLASPKTFGHTGFTGTCAWADPEHELVYIFLSNRVHPDMSNYKLVKQNIRTRIQDVIYKAIQNGTTAANDTDTTKPVHNLVNKQ